MNFASALYISAAIVGVVVAFLGLRFRSAPGSSRYRALAAVGLTAAVYATLDCLWTTNISTPARFLAAGLQGSVAALHVLAWQWYTRKHLGLRETRLDRAFTAVLLLFAGVWLVPGLMNSSRLVVLGVPWLGVFALGAIFVCAINDTLVSGEIVRAPLLLSVGFLVAVGALGHALTRSFVASLCELDHLSRSLERLVAERTDALVAAEATLIRTEKMAALGRLAAGVAHEINNPTAAVAANLAYLSDAIEVGVIPPDGRECVDESMQAIARITKIVGQLLDSGRAAANARSARGTASVRDAVREAIASARPRFGAHIVTSFDIAEGVFVRADAASLVQVIVNLVVNAAQAMPVERGCGHIEIRTRAEGGLVHIAVVDDGTGMTEETRRRIFEPFFTTKATGEGSCGRWAVTCSSRRAPRARR